MWLAGASLIVVLVAVAACGSGRPSSGGQASGLGTVALGQRIFDSGTDASGRPITRSRGTGMMMMGSAGCASCHGIDGHGQSTQAIPAPDITYANLTNPHGMRETDGSRGAVYTDALIRRAITTGRGADGAQLSAQMPRWQLSSQQLSELLDYLRALH